MVLTELIVYIMLCSLLLMIDSAGKPGRIMVSVVNRSLVRLPFHLLNFFFNTVVITEAPSSMSVPLYTLVNFACVGTGDSLTWTVEGNSLTDPSNQDREISVTTNNISVDVWSSVLTIRALPINDGISVGCGLTSISPLDHVSKGATLTVKGNFITLIVVTELTFQVCVTAAKHCRLS